MRKMKGAVSAAATLALAFGLCPAAFAAPADDAASLQAAEVSAQASEAMTSTWLQANGTTSNGSTRSFSAEVQADQVDAGYQLDITYTSKATVALDKFQYNGAEAEKVSETDSQVVYRIVVDNIDWAVPVTYGYTVTYGGSEHVMSHDVYLVVAADSDALSAKQETVSKVLALESGKDYTASVTWASSADGHDTTTAMAPATTNGKVGIAKADDGTYNITLRPSSNLVSGFEYPVGTAIEADENGAATINMATPFGGKQILTHITLPSGAVHDQDQVMTIDLSTFEEGSIMSEVAVVDKTNLNAAITAAKALEQGKKTAAAYTALQEAIAASEAVAANEDASDADVHASTQALRSAIAAFEADAGIEKDKLYTADAKVLKADSDEESMASGYVEPKVDIELNADGKYEVTVYVNADGAGQNAQVLNGDGTEAEKVSSDPLAYKLAVDSIAGPIDIKFAADAMKAMGVESQPARLSIDAATVAEKLNTMYRLYNPNSGEHLYTYNADEYEAVAAAGWTKESEEKAAWTAPAKSATPVYRLYNPYEPLGDHHYTTSKDEYDELVEAGWMGEGIGWYSDDAKGVPLYRAYNPNAYASGMTGAHHYTADEDEAKGLFEIGWTDEDIAWYGIA